MAADIVTVRLSRSGPDYSYFNHEETLVKGDIVLVELPNQGERVTPFATGVVVNDTPNHLARARATKWIVCKIDTTKYDALKQMMKPEV